MKIIKEATDTQSAFAMQCEKVSKALSAVEEELNSLAELCRKNNNESYYKIFKGTLTSIQDIREETNKDLQDAREV